ncbi:glucan biosynthesis protein [Amaricoccus sp.]|uniref:glucan biosynthesis protein n=1 Tax=Amaricoccus sp. TaxID=1872485 RepID=UPI002602EB16|nr:glucan biosynthesis protein [Amaricoccus sp.]HRO12916.1 glucan biosynthesis protein [Amaricoccus sp.]
MDRRSFLHTALVGLLGSRLLPFATPAAAQAAGGFSFDAVVARARETAGSPYVRPLMKMSPPFADLKYDQYRAIRPRDDMRLFADADRGFRMDLLPPGLSFQDRIEINLVSDGVAQPIAFSTDYFAFHPDFFPFPDGRAPSDLAADMGFSGLRLRHPVNSPGVWDDFAVFQGASYFRAVARDTLYGLSARGLAVGTGGPDPEEFPIFTAFWIHEPQPGDSALRLDALLDSDSVTGAFDFTIRPGIRTVMTVRSVLFPRRDVKAAGIAPLTSMYFFGPERRAGVDDFRDAVHDSDGLRMVNGRGERLWRPLRNPPRLETSAFADENPRAFGLIQRARDFAHYEDAEAHYERRPSAWVEPEGAWGKGAVTLVEIPSADEFTDNIVAFWRPAAPLAAGAETRFDYRLTWGAVEQDDQPVARVVATRSGLSILDPRERLFVVDFDLGLTDFDRVAPKLEVSAGEAKGLSIDRLPEGNRARVGFHFIAGDLPSAEFRLWLASDEVPASEVWLYRWSR